MVGALDMKQTSRVPSPTLRIDLHRSLCPALTRGRERRGKVSFCLPYCAELFEPLARLTETEGRRWASRSVCSPRSQGSRAKWNPESPPRGSAAPRRKNFTRRLLESCTRLQAKRHPRQLDDRRRAKGISGRYLLRLCPSSSGVPRSITLTKHKKETISQLIARCAGAARPRCETRTLSSTRSLSLARPSHAGHCFAGRTIFSTHVLQQTWPHSYNAKRGAHQRLKAEMACRSSLRASESRRSRERYEMRYEPCSGRRRCCWRAPWSRKGTSWT